MKTTIPLVQSDRTIKGRFSPTDETVIITCDTTDASAGDLFKIYLPDANDTENQTFRIPKIAGPQDPDHAIYIYPEEGLGQTIAGEDHQELIDNGDSLTLASDGKNYL